MSRFFKKRNVTHVRDVKSVDSLMDDDGSSPKALARVTGKDATFGMNPAIKTFYEGKNSQRGIYENFDWVETPPKQLSAKTLKVYDRVAIKVYKIKDLEQGTVMGRTPIKIHMIDVQSPHLLAALRSILAPVGVFLELHEVARFEAPFRPLYFCYDAIRARHQACADVDAVLSAHLKLLLAVLGELFDGFRTQLAHLRASGLVSYKLAWTYFARGSTAYVVAAGTERLVRVVDTVYRRGKCAALVVQGEQLAFDGDKFAWHPVQAFIAPFEGNLPITELEAFPFSFHPNPEAVSARLTARGRMVLDYQDLAYRECEGVGIFKQEENSRKHTVRGFRFSSVSTLIYAGLGSRAD